MSEDFRNSLLLFLEKKIEILKSTEKTVETC